MDTDLKVAKRQQARHVPPNTVPISVTAGQNDQNGNLRPRLAVINRPSFADRDWPNFFPRWMKQVFPEFERVKPWEWRGPIKQLPRLIQAIDAEDWMGYWLSPGATEWMDDYNDPADFGDYDWAKPDCMR
jgi:hypothetical protein